MFNSTSVFFLSHLLFLFSRIYTVLTRLFINLGVNEKTASDDACRIEHYISDESFKAIKKHMAQFC
ncbi:iron dependent repressor, metal binding and dimerization domain protein [Butyrivibrio sp. MC2021]|uniref:iron dependent repressor, metal binding and dimerization domain protein n=1 Tax=Butyrivibrio sp. MC2021 TaxID=1408306 RepID=UPI0009DD7C85|nr:iron dependent repressor, metal binding and dimerization domain protein [Butyrivibrio sp. MC2021]